MMLKMTFESFSARSCAVDFQTESVLALNKKLKVNQKFQFLIYCQNTFGLKVNCTWHDPALNSINNSSINRMTLIFEVCILNQKSSE